MKPILYHFHKNDKLWMGLHRTTATMCIQHYYNPIFNFDAEGPTGSLGKENA